MGPMGYNGSRYKKRMKTTDLAEKVNCDCSGNPKSSFLCVWTDFVKISQESSHSVKNVTRVESSLFLNVSSHQKPWLDSSHPITGINWRKNTSLTEVTGHSTNFHLGRRKSLLRISLTKFVCMPETFWQA